MIAEADNKRADNKKARRKAGLLLFGWRYEF